MAARPMAIPRVIPDTERFRFPRYSWKSNISDKENVSAIFWSPNRSMGPRDPHGTIAYCLQLFQDGQIIYEYHNMWGNVLWTDFVNWAYGIRKATDPRRNLDLEHIMGHQAQHMKILLDENDSKKVNFQITSDFNDYTIKTCLKSISEGRWTWISYSWDWGNVSGNFRVPVFLKDDFPMPEDHDYFYYYVTEEIGDGIQRVTTLRSKYRQELFCLFIQDARKRRLKYVTGIKNSGTVVKDIYIINDLPWGDQFNEF